VTRAHSGQVAMRAISSVKRCGSGAYPSAASSLTTSPAGPVSPAISSSMSSAVMAPFDDDPLLETLMSSSFGIAAIVAPASIPNNILASRGTFPRDRVFVSMSTMDRMSSKPTSCLGEPHLAPIATTPFGVPYLIGPGLASPGETSPAIDTQMGCSCISKDWARLSLANNPFEYLSTSSSQDVSRGEAEVIIPR
jgi:hypothetical protein